VALLINKTSFQLSFLFSTHPPITGLQHVLLLIFIVTDYKSAPAGAYTGGQVV